MHLRVLTAPPAGHTVVAIDMGGAALNCTAKAIEIGSNWALHQGCPVFLFTSTSAEQQSHDVESGLSTAPVSPSGAQAPVDNPVPAMRLYN